MASKNLKVTAVADTKKYQSDIKAAKRVTKDFGDTADGALNGMSKSLGINTELARKLNNAFKGLSANPIIALGSAAIAGLAAGFKALNGEAEAWARTVEGVRNDLQDTSYINTYKQAMHDVNTDIARSWDEMWDNVKRKSTEAISNLKTGFAQFVSNLKDGKGVVDAIKDSVTTTREASAEAAAKAEEAADKAGAIFDIQRKQKANLVEIAKIDAQIAELREKATDPEVSAEERLKAINEVQELIRKKYALQIPLQERLATLMKEQADLTNSSPEEIDAANDARVQAISLQTQMNNELRTTNKLQGTLTKEVQKARAASFELGTISSKNTLGGYSAAAGFGQGQSGIILPVRAEFDIDSWKDAQAKLQEQLNTIRSIAAEAFSSLGESLGSLVGDLLTGGDAFANFKNSALSAFGDMAQTIGKIAIAAGTATIAIQGALTTLQGWGAIAAGTALVALGAAVKQGLSNVASRGTMSSAAVATSSGGYSSMMSNDYMMRSVDVKVTGTLKASGSNLVAVLNNEENRKQHTT